MNELLVQLTEEQEAAVNAAVATVIGGGQLTIGGFAGTGKTTIIHAILDRLQNPKDPKAKRLSIAVAAFTGKACGVLRRKGVFSAQTLHSLMYEVTEDEKKQLVFVRRNILVVGDTTAPIHAVIVDEASMVSQQLYDDLTRFGLPIIWIGDHGQLEPIGDNPGVMVDPEIKLEKIHRQAASSPILKAAHAFREGQRIDWTTVPAGCGLSKVPRFRVKELAPKVDVILCGFNKTRHSVNSDVRKLLGKKGELADGERLICLKNDRQRGIYNGLMMTLKKVVEPVSITNTEGKLFECWSIIATDDDNRERHLTIYMVAPDEKTNEINTKYWADDNSEYPTNFVLADYGYCLTLHKAQGSEWDRVLVIEEIWVQKWDAKKWRYTAATRAAKELIWVQG